MSNPQDIPSQEVPRASEEAFLLTEAAKDGSFRIHCTSVDSSENLQYEITLRGAVNPTDESQPLMILKVSRILPKVSPTLIYENLSARGTVSEKGPLFVGFEKGALTGDFDASTKAHKAHLSLTDDPGASVLPVQCNVFPLPSPTNNP